MKQDLFEKFERNTVSPKAAAKILGGLGRETGGGDSFFGRSGSSTCDWNPGNGGSCTYYFGDNQNSINGDCLHDLVGSGYSQQSHGLGSSNNP